MNLGSDEGLINPNNGDERERNPYEQFHSLLQLAAAAMRAGNYAEAQDHLQQAQQQWTEENLGSVAAVQLLRSQIQLARYQRQFVEALQMAQRYLRLVDRESDRNVRVYARLLLGNLYRDAGQFRTAHYWYTETEKAIAELGSDSYAAWLTAQLAWLYLLEGRLNHTRLQLEHPRTHTDQNQAMYFQVVLAILYLLDAEWKSAELLLREALAFYEQAHNFLACCAIHLYLAYHALHQASLAGFLDHATWVFDWLYEHQLSAFPHWWHPKIMAEICTYAFMSNLYPELVEYMVVHHLGRTALPALSLLEKMEDVDLRRRAYRLQQVIIGLDADQLAHLRDTPGKYVLQELLRQGSLRPEMYSALERELMTATQRQTPNATLIAVFGLYVNGLSRSDIAKRLGCSLENVRNYITIIYQHFDLPADRYKGRELRRQNLIDLARTRGFIP